MSIVRRSPTVGTLFLALSLFSVPGWANPDRRCLELDPLLTVCESAGDLEQWASLIHVPEAPEDSLRTPLNPPDPVAVRDGAEIYQQLLDGVARETRVHLDLWHNTPAFSRTELAYFEAHPQVWAVVVRVRSARAGRPRRDALRDAMHRFAGDRLALRHLVLRNGFFYFESPFVARWAADHISLRDLFDDPTITLERAGESATLTRSNSGDYAYAEGELAGYRAPLLVLDRVGVDLEPFDSYHLPALRRALGLSHVEVGLETSAGRLGTAVFYSGGAFPAHLVRRHDGQTVLGISGELEQAAQALDRGRRDLQTSEALMATAFTMVREELRFDEPQREVGQQDGIMRPAFEDAYERGATRYFVNGVGYDIFDDEGRPLPPQVCVDFLTDAVIRFGGSWWRGDGAGERGRTPGTLDLTPVMADRRVRSLIGIADIAPAVVDRYAFGPGEQVPYGEGEAFFENLWAHRHLIRSGDVFVIFGLRSDGRNHFHSFYVYETDPVFGFPTVIADNAGRARLRSWRHVMSNAPRRSIHYRIRWNPEWLRGDTPWAIFHPGATAPAP